MATVKEVFISITHLTLAHLITLANEATTKEGHPPQAATNQEHPPHEPKRSIRHTDRGGLSQVVALASQRYAGTEDSGPLGGCSSGGGLDHLASSVSAGPHDLAAMTDLASAGRPAGTGACSLAGRLPGDEPDEA